ncbi:MAG: HAMP domain-containing sensor histidine kinase [Comamonadaceae bacterium]
MNQLGSLRPQQLEQAFQVFNSASSELCTAYMELQQQALVLTQQLELANGELRRQFAEREALRASAERKERLAAMGEMAARLAHQLRTPLATALLYASQLGEASLPAPVRAGFATKTVERLRDLDRLIGDTLQFARGVDCRFQSVGVTEILRDALQTMQPQAKTQGLVIELDDHAGSRALLGDRAALTAAVVSLLDNAVRACASGGKIDLSATIDGDQLAIRVCDTGVGITPEVLARLFEPFFTTRRSGTGLGLAIVRTVAEAHGGSVSACSTPGAGSQFTFSLPLLRSPATPVEKSVCVTGVIHDIAATADC